MKSTYRKLVRQRVEAALRLKMRPVGPQPVMDDPVELPSEIIDLSTGPFARRFPDLAERSRRRRLDWPGGTTR